MQAQNTASKEILVLHRSAHLHALQSSKVEERSGGRAQSTCGWKWNGVRDKSQKERLKRLKEEMMYTGLPPKDYKKALPKAIEVNMKG